MTNKDYVIYFFALVGAMTLIYELGCILCRLFQSAKEKIQKAKRKREIKHRFDKKPMGKCYCADCAYYDKDCGVCYNFDQYIKDNGFCYKAKPIQ